MTQRWERAIVIGAGMGGLLCARALAERFTEVLVLERDSLPADHQPRSGVPQGRHFHGLLAGGRRAMEALLPGLDDDIREAGAVEMVTGWSTRVERPGYDPYPRRDLGFSSFSLSRPLLELCVRRVVQRTANLAIQHETAVERLLHAGQAVTGVALRDGREIQADLVVDASGRGELTLRAFDAMGLQRPRETAIGIDTNYATAVFKIPDGASQEWQGLFTFPKAPESSKGLLLSTIEGGQWICAVGWRGEEEQAPTDRESYVEWMRNLRTQTGYHAVKDAQMLGKVQRFAFPESRYRHFARSEALPAGLLPVGDSICRFNPIYGQGMSVAALEAETLLGLLAEGDCSSEELPRRFLQRCEPIIDGPWNMAALPDFVFPNTRGERPADLAAALKFGQALTELGARDASVHKLMQEVSGLLKPRTALTSNPALMQRVYDVMSAMEQVALA